MDSAKATFFRAELARTPSEFMPLDAAAIQAELERRWDEKHGIITLDEKLSEEDAKGNSLTYCGQSLLGHRYMIISEDGGTSAGATPPAPCKKRAREEPYATPEKSALVAFLQHFKKDTLQSMCDDLEVSVSGNKTELVYRIIAAIE